MFDKDGCYSFRTCKVVELRPKRIFDKEADRYVNDPENNRVVYRDVADSGFSFPYFCDEKDIDGNITDSKGSRKVVVLTSPDGKLAKDILLQGFENSIDEHLEAAKSLRKLIEQLKARDL